MRRTTLVPKPAACCHGSRPRRFALKNSSSAKGPTHAKSYMLVVLMRDGLTTAEQTMLDFGHPDLVRQFRQIFQNAVTERLSGLIEDLTGRKVLTYQSQVLFAPNLVCELFVFDSDDTRGAAEATAEGQLTDGEVGTVETATRWAAGRRVAATAADSVVRARSRSAWLKIGRIEAPSARAGYCAPRGFRRPRRPQGRILPSTGPSRARHPGLREKRPRCTGRGSGPRVTCPAPRRAVDESRCRASGRSARDASRSSGGSG